MYTQDKYSREDECLGMPGYDMYIQGNRKYKRRGGTHGRGHCTRVLEGGSAGRLKLSAASLLPLLEPAQKSNFARTPVQSPRLAVRCGCDGGASVVSLRRSIAVVASVVPMGP